MIRFRTRTSTVGFFFNDRMTDRSVEGHFCFFAVSAIFVETRWDTHEQPREQLPVHITDETTLADTLERVIE